MAGKKDRKRQRSKADTRNLKKLEKPLLPSPSRDPVTVVTYRRSAQP